MDSLKLPKGSGSKSSVSIPLAIRFNASEESIEDVIKQPSESLSCSPQQSSDDFSWRKDFLQGGFFHRKRSGSVEGASATGATTLISNLSSSDTNAVGTWKLIKGKVSQAMEDIKAAKSPQAASKADANDDSDLDTINSSMSDELSIDTTANIIKPKSTASSTGHKTDSDSDIDGDIFLTAEDLETTTIRRSFANLRSKAISRNQSASTSSINNSTNKMSKKTEESSPTRQPSSSLRSSFLRNRKKKQETDAIPIVKPKKDVEIESGIEMFEEMILPTTLATPSTTTTNDQSGVTDDDYDKISADELGVNISGSSISFKNKQTDGQQSGHGIPSAFNHQADIKAIKADKSINGAKSCNNINKSRHEYLQRLKFVFGNVYKNFSVILTLVLLLLLLILPLPDFFRGVISSLFMISLFSCIYENIKIYVERRNTIGGPERCEFRIPDYSTMPVCEIPAIEEHKPLKTYSGWMNEINNYDPSNYHISMTRSVFVRLDGSILRVSNTTTRVPKRAMWNEQLIDKKNVTFSRTRCFNLLGCRVEMCPKGLARKRHFSRKYPIQLIIKYTEKTKDDETSSNVNKRHQPSPLDKADISSNIQTTTATTTTTNTTDNFLITNQSTVDNSVILHQNSNESNDDKSEKTNIIDNQADLDFGNTILNSDLQKLQDSQEIHYNKDTVPCGDETRILLFARSDREKEDWYRRFYTASVGAINDAELRIPDIVMVSDEDISGIKSIDEDISSLAEKSSGTTPMEQEKRDSQTLETSLFEGLLMSPCAGRNPPDYIKFMARYQKACTQSKIPVFKSPISLFSLSSDIPKRSRRQKRQEDELWKGIDQSLYLGPCGSVVWANVLVGRILFSCLNDAILLEKIQEFLQRKLSAIRLPSFMEDVVIAQVYLGDTPPLIHKVSQPLLDERGTWIDADVTYEGLMHMTITTKLNLLRLKRQQNQPGGGNPTGISVNNSQASSTDPTGLSATETASHLVPESSTSSTPPACAIYDSNAESSGASSSESESPTLGTIDATAEPQAFYPTPGSSRRLLRIVDRITASNLFQSATELPYIQRAMENMSTKITLRVELKGLVSRVVINIPPPPSDRIWLAFRGPPRLWISAKPAVGDHTFDWSIVTNVIENKLCDEVYKYLVYPNMVDVIVPFLGQSTYKE